MKPLHESMETSSPLSSMPKAELSTNYTTRPINPRRRQRQRRRRRLNVPGQLAPNHLCLLFGLLLPHAISQAPSNNFQNSEQHEPLLHRHLALSPDARSKRTLSDGLTECGSCEVTSPNFSCSGTTINDDLCAPCATGQTWWPCNIQNECYCKDLAAAAAEEAAMEAGLEGLDCDIPLCKPGESGTRVVPFSRCERYVTCTAGVPGPEQSCAGSMKYSQAIQACNVASMVVCPEDPNCPPTAVPTASPVDTPPPSESMSPSVSSYPTWESDKVTTTVGGGATSSGGGAVVAPVNGAQGEMPQATSPIGSIAPETLEGMYVLDAHMAANKIMLTRELLSSPGGGGRRTANNNDFSYAGFRSSLQRMITTPIANQTFYIGDSINENGRAYGLVNIAAFLAMSYEDSIAHGSCDEVNTDVVGGVLPISNACGQHGQSYQDMTCKGEDAIYNCNVDPAMMMSANPVSVGVGRGRSDPGRGGGNGGGEVPPKPFYCGPKESYEGGYTGYWDYVSGSEVAQPPVKNELGRQDVEGCCWWGRGSIQLRGTCAYGKLNYHLGKRAADEGRSSAMFPDVDFCLNPQAICSHERYPDLKWIAGMFRWITEVQTYNTEEFDYFQRLMEFVDGGLQDWSFVHGVSGIVTQGCHSPPCIAGAEFDGVNRKATFIKTLRLLGLKVKDNSGVGITAGSRRLGGST